MQRQAGSLIQEDSAASRGLESELELIEESRQLDAVQESRYSDVQSPVNNQRGSFQDDENTFKFADRSNSLYHLGSPLPNESKTAKKAKRKAFWRRAFVNVLFIASWYLFSTLLSVYNKWMFSPEHHNFGFPLFVTTFHMLVQFILSGLVLSLFPRLRPTSTLSPREYASKAAPCGVATGLDIGLSNLSLKTITLSFYTMCKSSTLGFVLLFAFIFHLETPTWRLTGIIALITIGLILMVSGETKVDIIGMAEVLSASAMGGLRWALTQKLLDKEAMGLNNPFATLFWLAPVMAVTLAVCSLVIEGPTAIFADDRFWGSVGRTLETGSLILFPGLLAFFMTTSEFALIQRTSVVTLSVAGIFKEVSTIFLSTTIFHDELTPINISGLCITLVGIVGYNYLRYYEAVAAPSKHRTPSFEPVQGQESMNGLPMYNMANESALFPTMANDDKEIQHTIIGEDDEFLSDEDSEGSIRKEHQHVGPDEPEDLIEDLAQDDDLKRLDNQTDLLEQELDDGIRHKST